MKWLLCLLVMTAAAQTPPGTMPATMPATLPGATMPNTQPSTQPTALPEAATRPTTMPATAPAGPLVRRPAWERYRVIVDRSMFSRERSDRTVRRRSDNSGGPRVERPTNHSLVLTGIAVAAGQPVAFLEDTRSGATVRATAGQAIGQGTLRRIAVDHIEYEGPAGLVQVSPGSSLDGGEANLGAATGAATQPSASSSSNVPATGPSGEGAGGGGSVLERLRARRQQELGK